MMTDASRAASLGITISPLQSEHNLSRFCCGDSGLDKFINKKAAKFHTAHRARVFCAHKANSAAVLGLYSLSIVPYESSTLKAEERQIAPEPFFSAVYIQSLAVLRHYQNQGIGTILLLNAIRRCYDISQNASLFAMALRSANERTTKFYEQLGFDCRTTELQPLMILPMRSIIDLFEGRKPT